MTGSPRTRRKPSTRENIESPSSREDAPSGAPLRMKDLCVRTGLARQAVHFYIAQGLIPPGTKTGKNTANYSEIHIERIQLIRQLQTERFLPLRAIKAILDGQTKGFTREQRGQLRDIGRGFQTGPLAQAASSTSIAIGSLAKQLQLSVREVNELADAGLLRIANGKGGKAVLAEDAWIVETWGQIKALGFDETLGLKGSDLSVLDDVAQTLLDRLLELLGPNLASVPPARAAKMIEAALPLAHRLVIGLHTAKVRALFAAMDVGNKPAAKKTTQRRSSR